MSAAPDKPSMYCRQCQYVLDGLPDNHCPECGTGFDPSGPASYLSHPKQAWPLRWETVASALCLVVFLLLLSRGRNFGGTLVFDLLLPTPFLAFGVAFGWSGTKRGSKLSRTIPTVLLVIALLSLYLILGDFATLGR